MSAMMIRTYEAIGPQFCGPSPVLQRQDAEVRRPAKIGRRYARIEPVWLFVAFMRVAGTRSDRYI